MPKLKHFDNLGTARFITFSCYHRYQLLIENKPRDIFLDHLKTVTIKYEIDILGYVLMPEHVHLVLYPRRFIKMGRLIGEIKSLSAREILLLLRRQNNTILKKLIIDDKQRFWQKRCYDHNCRTIETVREKINYCHKNPVIRGLVKSPQQWIYSSYRWYEGMEDVVLDIDGLQM